MSRKRKNSIDEIVSQAESEGLSYGQYAARERPVIVQRHIVDIDKPRGMSTIQAALQVDCPRLCHKVDKLPKSQPSLKVKIPEDETIALYEAGYSVREIADKLCRPTRNIAARLRKAGFELEKGYQRRLSREKIQEIKLMRARGKTFRDIAFECNVSEATVCKYLKKEVRQ